MDDLRGFCLSLFVMLLLFKPTLQQPRAVELSSRIERVALLQLRSSLGLRSKDWPIKADPCTVWAGILCENGKVIGINISGFKRTRIGSQNPQFNVDSLALFSGLLSFNASRFMLPGSIPEWFGQRLRTLQVLDLRGCSVVGAIPPSLGNMTRLSELYLANNDLTGTIPDSLGQLSSLYILDISQNGLTGVVPPSFGSLKNLTSLDMSVNYLYGIIPPAIGALSKLEILNLSNNSLSSLIPSQLSNLSSLVDLDLSFNSFSGSLPDFRVLKNLQRMVIGSNQLSGYLPDNMFAPLTKLQFVILSHNNFTGEIPSILWSMPSLRFLDASANNFTGILPNLSFVPSANSAIFNLSRNMLYGGLTTVVERFSFIDLSDNYFQGKVPDYARSNVSLAENCLRDQTSQRATSPCASFYAERGLAFDNFGVPNATQPPPRKPHKNNHKRLIILAAVLGSVGFIALMIIVLVLLIVCTRKRTTTSQRGNVVEPVLTSTSPPPPGVSLNFSSLGEGYTYQQILQATGNFSDADLIKHGHSGDLFRGILEGGISVVIKKIDLNIVKKEAHMQELDFFSKISHLRFVPLLGHCLDNESEKYLIYKYMPNGDLPSSLYRKTRSEDDSLQSLDWITRLKIATGVAEALSYLHHECSPPLVHRDIQASSILLDDKFEVRLGSLSEICAQEGETSQSKITRLLRFPQSSEQGASGGTGTPAATCAYDVYCFGKVLLELVTGKLGMSASSDGAMKEWLEGTLPYISIYDKELVTNIIDPSLIIDEDLLEEVWAMAIVARSCLNPKPARRPLMRYILKDLENPLKVVREESTGSARLKTTSSRGSWNATVFGSWRTTSDVAAAPAATTSNKMEGANSLKHSGTSGSQGSGQNNGGDHSSSYRRQQSRDIFPEPLDEGNLESRQG
ncbi:probable LRR receptor-like serine/threonine-protein kinase At2g16250 [Daucus carota subsp. sativus]|uniref:non-specific serine/threonine protein kinase n=1 Tax=Daucus carota subsp. sativus TaxID=79200 RepID=A0A175YEY0_DAUCS|nr:PREDICTED: probable LRR receptor-like serine/threonine-protein kinase At2g16250 [Daucus carota subsp. sativus]